MMDKIFLFLCLIFGMCLSAQTQRLPAGENTGRGFVAPLYFKPSEKNPTLPRGAEAQMIMQEDGVTCDQWFRLVGDTAIYYRTADNEMLDNWSDPVKCVGLSGEFPTVFKISTLYYMFLKTKQIEGDVFLFSSSDKIHWQVMNGGRPSIIHSPDRKDWRFNLFNVGACAEGTTVHVLVEGIAGDDPTADMPSKLGYAVADITNPVFTLTKEPQIANGANPELVYVPERSGIVVLYNDFTMSKTDPPNYYSSMRTAKASLAADLLDPGSWKKSSLYFPSLSDVQSNIYPADQAIVFTPGKRYPCMMYYNFHQRTGYQAYAPGIHNETDLYESIADTDGENRIPVFHKLSINREEARYHVDVDGDVNVTGSYLYRGKPVALGLSLTDTTISGSYTIQTADWGRTIFVKSGAPVMITVPHFIGSLSGNSAESAITIIQEMKQRVVIQPADGVLLNGRPRRLKLNRGYAAAKLIPRGENLFTIIGSPDR